eukprot:TRINITY_DN26918_c0_g2_i1.p1 TRINITY_DN26918_c0_g2~~TRINITY_DN26918_c0_g2_i1.p1  ORF type:complete len:844 (-),score=189.36 TRINITY_DN26918_c0_g2_i1:35-2545(-)
MALRELSTALRERKAFVEASSCSGEADGAAEIWSESHDHLHVEQHLLRLDAEAAELRQHLDAEFKTLRHGFSSIAEAVHALQAALLVDAELDQENGCVPLRSKLEFEAKELRSEVAELIALRVKPRLAALERDASETRRRFLLFPTCSLAGTHRADCRGRSASPCRFQQSYSLPALPENAQGFVEDAGHVALAQARRQLERQEEEAAQSQDAYERRLSATLEEAGQELASEARAAVAVAAKSANTAASELLAGAAGSLRAELARVKGISEGELRDVRLVAEEAEAALRKEFADLRTRSDNTETVLRGDFSKEFMDVKSNVKEIEAALRRDFANLRIHADEVETALRGDISKVRISSSEAGANLQLQVAEARNSFFENDKALRSELGRAFARAGDAEVESKVAVQAGSRLSAGVRGVEELLERKAQWALASREELETSIAAERRRISQCEEDMFNRLRRFEDIAASESKALAQSVNQLSEAVASSSNCRQAEELKLWTKVQELTRAICDQAPQKSQDALETVERITRSTRAELQDELRKALQGHSHEARAEFQKEMSTLRRDIAAELQAQVEETLALADSRADRRGEDLLRNHWPVELRNALQGHSREAQAELHKEISILRHDMVGHFEAHVKDSLALSVSRSERREEDLLRDHLSAFSSRQLAEVRILATTTERKCEQHIQRIEDQARSVATNAQEEARHFAVKMEERAVSLASQTAAQVAKQAHASMEDQLLSFEAAANSAQSEASLAAAQARLLTEEHSASAAAAKSDVEVCKAATRNLRDELLAFIDEQRVFCGFLDTEQRSYQELIRQEVTTLSRLVDASLRCHPLPKLEIQ